MTIEAPLLLTSGPARCEAVLQNRSLAFLCVGVPRDVCRGRSRFEPDTHGGTSTVCAGGVCSGELRCLQGWTRINPGCSKTKQLG